MAFDREVHPEAVEDVSTSLHQHMTGGYEDHQALKAEAGFAPDMWVTAADLREAEFARINAAFAKAAPNAKPFDGFYQRGGVR
jgi:hypothetical protein